MKTTIHKGPVTTIPEAQTTPGLQLLKSLLPTLDTDPNRPALDISQYFSPTATFQVNSNPPAEARNVLPLLQMRKRHLTMLQHEVDVVWDIETGGGDDSSSSFNHPGGGAGQGPQGEGSHQRTVMFEGTTVTVFKVDLEQFPVRLKEFNVLELEGDEEGELKVVEMRTYVDTLPLRDRAAGMQPEAVSEPQ